MQRYHDKVFSFILAYIHRVRCQQERHWCGHVTTRFNNLRPVFYASNTLTDTESNYSNIEHEMLGVVFSIIHLKHFKFGHKLCIITDHKPLITLFRKKLHATSPRLSRMLVQILDYNIDFHHQEGTKMHLSDALSRLNTHDSIAEKSRAKLVVDFNVITHDVEILTGFKSLSLDQVRQETECDTDMQLCLNSIFQMVFPSLNHVYQSQFNHFMITENV